MFLDGSILQKAPGITPTGMCHLRSRTDGCVRPSKDRARFGKAGLMKKECGCKIGDKCYYPWAVNPENPCQRASECKDPATGCRNFECTGAWVGDDGLTCRDNVACAANQVCG
jgi:hypothetical protein